jgi:hypothetical protein
MTPITNGSKVDETRSIQWKRFVELGSKNWSAVLGSNTPALTKKIGLGSVLLKDIATVSGAATVSEAYEYKELLFEAKPESNEKYFKFVNTGTIDRYEILWGIKPTTYIKSKFNKPIVPKGYWSRNSAENRHF